MIPTRTPWPSTVLMLLLPTLLALGCRSEEEKTSDALTEKVMITLENTPEHLAVEVMRTCDKWKRIAEGRPCIEAEARHDQFECWLQRGYPKLEHGYKYKLRQRVRDQTTLLKLDHCMELRRWRLVESRRDTYDHLFGKPAGPAPAKP
jgi:hypothetical protein